MTKYRVVYDKKFIKDMEKVPRPFQKGLKEIIENLPNNPRPHGSMKLQGSKKTPLYRIRHGDYRIIYTIQDDVLIIILIELGHRKEIYR